MTFANGPGLVTAEVEVNYDDPLPLKVIPTHVLTPVHNLPTR